MLMALVVASVATQAQDVYIGTIRIHGKTLILKRCDAVQNEYRLVDAPSGSAVVSAFLKKHTSDDRYWYAEVIAEYEERNGKNILLVEALDNLKPHENCHLLGEP